jgi:hypothetical protein
MNERLYSLEANSTEPFFQIRLNQNRPGQGEPKAQLCNHAPRRLAKIKFVQNSVRGKRESTGFFQKRD